MIARLRLFSPAIVCGVWAVMRFAGAHSDVLAGVFLTVLALSIWTAEKERQRLTRKNRGPYHRRQDDDD